MVYYAHKTVDGRVQTMREHAENTSEMARDFAGAFGFGNYGGIIGLYHDSGKYSPDFQRRLNGDKNKYEHSSAGAWMLAEPGLKMRDPVYMMLAHTVGGHHSGLPDTGTKVSNLDGTLFAKLNRREKMPYDYGGYETELGKIPQHEKLPAAFANGYSLHFLGRMLFSSLVDADFLDTERFISDGRIGRDGGDGIDTLKQRFDIYMEEKYASAAGELNAKRSEILASCRSAADGVKGIFRLTVPTGGGKTLSSAAFALNHALLHGMKRIIYVIPYINIISQTVEKFAEIFGEENILGHYSTAEFKPGDDDERSAAELASENWDKPIIVTTNVQFFESLHSCRTLRCRKLHNIANSVLIFDEAQMLPFGYLRSCLRVVEELTKNYGCTAILCTATQPSLDGLLGSETREICPDVAGLYDFFKRVNYQVIGTRSDEELCAMIGDCESALCVLNSRMGTRKFYDLLKGDGVFHLSTYMTPAHIARTLIIVKYRLANGLPCKVISTSLVEAGVDLDFPAAFREEAGLDSIIQVGGRCNREGKNSADESLVTVFRREKFNRRFDEVCAITERICERYSDIASPEAIKAYFDRLYFTNESEADDKLDAKSIIKLLEKNLFNYRTVSDLYRLIETDQRQVLIPSTENAEICELIRKGKRSRDIMRKVSRHTVSLYEYEFIKLNETGVLTDFGDIAILEDPGCYDEMTGLKIKDTGEAIFG